MESKVFEFAKRAFNEIVAHTWPHDTAEMIKNYNRDASEKTVLRRYLTTIRDFVKGAKAFGNEKLENEILSQSVRYPLLRAVFMLSGLILARNDSTKCNSIVRLCENVIKLTKEAKCM